MKIKHIILSTVAGILGLVAVNSTLYTVDETQQAVVTRFGKPIRTIKEPGLNTKIPFIDKVNYFDDRLLEYDDAPRRCPTKDKKFIDIDNYARWRIKDPLKFMQSVRTEDGAQTRLDDIIYSWVRDGVGKHNLLEVVRNTNTPIKTTEVGLEGQVIEQEEIKVGREKIMNYVTEGSDEAAIEYGIAISDVRIKRADYPKDIQNAVFGRMKAERNRIAQKYRSEGESEKLNILGRKEKELKKILSEAYKISREIEGKADAEAVEIYANAFEQDPDFYSFLKTLETYKETLGSGAKLILSTNSEFFKYLKSQEKK